MQSGVRLDSIVVAVAFLCAAMPPMARADERLASRIGCADCHAAARAGIGPAYRDIAQRYRGQPDAREALVRVVKQGGKGRWTAVTGGVSMPPHSALLNDAETRQLVDWVLGH